MSTRANITITDNKGNKCRLRLDRDGFPEAVAEDISNILTMFKEHPHWCFDIDEFATLLIRDYGWSTGTLHHAKEYVNYTYKIDITFNKAQETKVKMKPYKETRYTNLEISGL